MYPILAQPTQPAPTAATAAPAWQDRSILEVMWSVRRLMILLMVVGAVLGGVAWLIQPPVYEASARLYVQRPPVSGAVNPFQSGGATAAGPSAQEAVIKSYAVLLAAMQEPGMGAGPVLAKKADPITFLRKKLSVSVADDKETFTLKFRSTDPAEAADVINAVVRNYIHTQHRRANVALGSALDPTPAPPTTTDAGPDTADTPAPTFAVSVGSREMMSRLAEQELTRLGQELNDAEIRAQAAQTRLKSARAASHDVNHLLQLALESQGQVQIDPGAVEQIRQLEVALNTAQSRLSAVRDYLGPEHRVRKRYESDIVLLGQQLAEARSRAAENLLATFAKAADQSRARLDHLRQRVDATRQAARSIEQLAIEVLDPAVPPRKAVAPKLVVYVAVGMLAGFFIATVVGLVGEVRRVAEASDTLGTLGAPAAPGGMLALPGPAHATAMQTGWDRPVPAEQGPVLLGSIPRIAATHRLVGPGYDRAADSVHQLRAVLSAMAHKENLKSVAFVSPRRGTGRTSVTIGVASSLAMSGTSVLAVDGDLSGRLARRQQAQAKARGTNTDANADTATQKLEPAATLEGMAQQSGHFQHNDHESSHQHHNGNGSTNGHARADAPPTATGIAGFLDGQPLEHCLKTASSERLAFLPASSATERHVGVFSGKKMADLIDQAREHFDLILFDSGPIPGSLEALSIASVADGVVLVLEESHDMAEYQRTLQQLRVINAKVLGVVVNKVGHRADDPANAHAAHTPADRRTPTSPDTSGDQAPQQPNAGPDFAEAGSGILAVSVFTDAQAGYHDTDWELTAVNDILPDAGDDLPEIKPTKR